MRALLVLAAATGCAQVLGIDNTSAKPPSPATLRINRVSIGAAVVGGPLDLTNESATFYVPDATDPTGLRAVPGLLTASDTWSADVATAADIQYTLPEMPRLAHLHEVGAHAQSDSFVVMEHPGAQPAPTATQEKLSVTLATPYVAGDGLVVEAIGAWTAHALTPAELPLGGAMSVTATIPYSAFSATTPSAPARITANDTVLVLRYSGPNLVGVMQTSFDQSDTTDTISGNVTQVLRNEMTTAMISPSAFASRFAMAHPAGMNASTTWGISAAPGWQYGLLYGPALTSGTVAATDTQITATYDNPFESLQWHTAMNVYAADTRPVTVDGASGALGSVLYTVVEPAQMMTFDMSVPLPLQVTLDDAVQLASDGMSVPLDPATAHHVTFTTEPGTATAYLLSLVELAPMAPMSNTLTTTIVAQAIGDAPDFTLPPGLFQHGHTYTLTATAINGAFPSAASGDFQARGLPFTQASLASGTFTVTP